MSKTVSAIISAAVSQKTTTPVYLIDMGWDAVSIMEYDGSTGYYGLPNVTTAGNKVTIVGRFSVGSLADDQRIITASLSDIRAAVTVKENDHASVANKLQFLVKNSSGTIVCNYSSSITVTDSILHTFMVAYDGDAGTAIMYIDGVEVGDATAPIHTLTTGTLETGLTSFAMGGEYAGAGRWFDGQIGFLGYRDAYLTNYQDFMDGSSPKTLDESTWTEWGSQPLFWNSEGEMDDNQGSAGNMTKNGTITKVSVSDVTHKICTWDTDISWNSENWQASGAAVKNLSVERGRLILPNGDDDPWLALVNDQVARDRDIDIYEHHTSTASPQGSDAVLLFSGRMDGAVIDGINISINLLEGRANKAFPPSVLQAGTYNYLLPVGTKLYFKDEILTVN